MEPQNPNPNMRRRLDSGELAGADPAGYAPRGGPAANDGLPVEDMPTRAMPIVGGAPPREQTAERGPASWARPATPPAPTQPPPGAEPPIPPRSTPSSPYIPPRPAPPTSDIPRSSGWAPPAQLEALDANAPRPRGAGTIQPAKPTVTPSQTKRGGALGWVAGTLLGLLVLALAAAFAVSGWYEGQYAGRIYPGVQVLGADLGGQTPAQAHDTLQAEVDAFTKQPVVLVWQDKQWQPTPEQMGLTVNLDRTIDNAFRVGRAGDTVGNVRDRWNARNGGITVPLVVGMNQQALLDYLNQEVAPQVNQPVVEGEIWLQGEQIHTTPAQEGREVRVYDTIQAITNGLATLATSNIELPVAITRPTIGADEINEDNRLLQTYLSGPLVAQAPNKQYTLDRKAVAGLVSLTRDTDPAAPRHYILALNDAKLQAVVDDWASEINIAPQNARFDWNNGQVSVLKESQNGYELQMTDTLKLVKDALNTLDKRTVTLPVTTLAPKIGSQDAGKLNIQQEIGHGNTTFAGSSAARATNIKVGANYLNGAVVAPGDSFSILDTIAPIDLDRGYVEGYVIAAERTQKGVGGGTCQVSTTMFRAAFWAGLDITERNAHAYRVGVYEAKGEPVGFDAAVFDPGVDLKFINNTPGYILIKTNTDNQELNVYIYGTPIADDVKLLGPDITNVADPPPDVYQLDPTLPPGGKQQVETARKGLDVTIRRQVLKDGKVIAEDSFFSHFAAWPNWYLVAPGVQTPSPPRPADPTVHQ